jgi:hypothetical protein
MTIARAQLIDPSVTRWYHCVTRCVRRAPLLAEGSFDRKAWLERRIEELAGIFAISVGAYSILDDQIQLLVRHEAEIAGSWSATEVVRRRARLYPPYDKSRRPLPVTDQWVAERRKDAAGVLTAREQLQNIGRFMKCLKEPLSRMANREDHTGGPFFDERFKSVGILDDQSLLAACVYIDLSPPQAAKTAQPSKSPYTSIKTRADHLRKYGRAARSRPAAPRKIKAGAASSAAVQHSLWLCPIEDRFHVDKSREGMFTDLSLLDYLLLVDYSASLDRRRKASASSPAVEILTRLGYSAQRWLERLGSLQSRGLFGRFSADSRERLRDVADHLGLAHLANVGGMPKE